MAPFDVELDQLSIDQDWCVSEYCGALFVDAMADWPMCSPADLYAGGRPPLSSLGIRALVRAAWNLTFWPGCSTIIPPGGASGRPRSADSAAYRST